MEIRFYMPKPKKLHSEFIKDLKSKNEYFRDNLFSILEPYNGTQHKLLIKDKFGECRVLTNDLLRNYKPRIESAVNKNEYFKNKATSIHGSNYDYSFVNYISKNQKVDIVCKIHGKFKQTPDNHLMSKGCPKCGNLEKSKYQSKTPTGWGLTMWKNKGVISKHFTGFKVYIVEVVSKEERFFKIGRTFTNIEVRLQGLRKHNYYYTILKIYKGTAEEMFILERDLKRNNKKYNYIPINKFDGYRECFSTVVTNTLMYAL